MSGLFQQEIVEIAVDQCGNSQERKVVLIDKNNDCFLSAVKTYGSSRRILKIGIMLALFVPTDAL